MLFVNISFPQCNVYTGIQGGCLTFTPMDDYLNSATYDLTINSCLKFELI